VSCEKSFGLDVLTIVGSENAEDLVDEYWVTKGGQQKRKDVFREINDFKSSKGSRPSRKASQESVSKAEKTKQKTPKSPPAKKRKAAEPGKLLHFVFCFCFFFRDKLIIGRYRIRE
jgi:hypothetical protein